MHHKIAITLLTAFLFSLSLNFLGAQPQGLCNKDSFAGTYVFYEKGSSAVFSPSSPGSSEFPFWAGAYAPFVTVGEVTMKPSGVGEGFYWIRVGSINGGADPIPVTLTVTELNNDCTGKFSYSLQLPGAPEETTVTERFILFDNGREFRTIPTLIENGVPYLTWIGEGHRLSKPGEPLNNCGPHTAKGSYLMAVENMIQFNPTPPIVSDVLLLRYDVSMNGDYTGTLYENLGGNGDIVLPTSGTIKVNPDCSYESTLNFKIGTEDVSIDTRGVYFDEGKKFYGLAVTSGGIQFSFGEGVRTTE